MRHASVVVLALWASQVEELAGERHLMGCEFEATETTVVNRQKHVKTVCLGNGLGCMVDTPMGHMTCTRRTWLLLQQAPDATVETKKRKQKVSPLQGKLV